MRARSSRRTCRRSSTRRRARCSAARKCRACSISWPRARPKLVEELTPKLLPLATVQRVLQNLLDEGVHIRDLRTILETLADHAPRTQDPNELTAAVRVALGRSIVQQIYGTTHDIIVIALDPELERVLQQVLGLAGHRGRGHRARSRRQACRAKSAMRCAQQEALGQPTVLLVPDRLRCRSRACCGAAPRHRCGFWATAKYPMRGRSASAPWLEASDETPQVLRTDVAVGARAGPHRARAGRDDRRRTGRRAHGIEIIGARRRRDGHAILGDTPTAGAAAAVDRVERRQPPARAGTQPAPCRANRDAGEPPDGVPRATGAVHPLRRTPGRPTRRCASGPAQPPASTLDHARG